MADVGRPPVSNRPSDAPEAAAPAQLRPPKLPPRLPLPLTFHYSTALALALSDTGRFPGRSPLKGWSLTAKPRPDPGAPSTALLAAIADALGVGIAAIDDEGRQTYVNPAFARMVGWPPGELVGARPPFAYWPPDDVQRIADALDLTVRGKAPPEGFELRFQRRDGSRFDALVSVRPFHPKGNGGGWVAAVTDISQQKRDDARLRYQAEVLETVGEAVIATDVKGRIVYWNREAERLYGWQRDEVLGRSVLEVTVPPEDAVGREIVARLGRGEPWRGQYEVKRRDGSRFPARVTLRPFRGESGEVLGIIGISADVTELVHAEDARRDEARLVDTVQEVGRSLASELDLRKVVQEVTDAGTSLTGAQMGALFYNVRDDSGQAFTLYTISGASRAAFADLPMPRMTPLFSPVFYGDGIVRSDDVLADPRYGRGDRFQGLPQGHPPVRSFLAVPVISRTGEVLGGLFFGHERPGAFRERDERIALGIASWAAVAMDNATLYEAEQRARAAAEAASHAKSDFLAVVSHELRTPLNAMIGYTELLLSGIPETIPDRARAKIERIGLSARHLRQLIEEILTFSRLEAGEESVEPATTDPAASAREVEALMEPLALAKGLDLALRVPEQPSLIETDPRKLRQVLLNLVSNAIKFTDVGSVAIELRQVGDETVFSIRDTGRGIDPENLERIFDAFWQVQGGATRTHGGTGLGLSVTRRLARLLGGEVAVKSRPGKGSTFTVRLPSRAPAPAAVD